MDTLGSVAGLVWLRLYMRVGSEDYGFVCLGIVGVGLVGMRYLLVVWVVPGIVCYWVKLVQALNPFSEWLEVWVYKTQAFLVALLVCVGGWDVSLGCKGYVGNVRICFVQE